MLNESEIHEILDAAVATGLASHRPALMASVSRLFAPTITDAASPLAQLLVDLTTMNSTGMLEDGTTPLASWLRTAIPLAGGRVEAEVFRRALLRVSSRSNQFARSNDLIALGDQILAEGELTSTRNGLWVLRLHRFIIGGPLELANLTERFDQTPLRHRYVIVHSTGQGRTLAAAPSWRRDRDCFDVEAAVTSTVEKENTRSLRDVSLETFRDVEGIEAAIERIRCRLSQQDGDLEFDSIGRQLGSRLRRLCERVGSADRLDELIKLELIRLSTVPIDDAGVTPLGFISHVEAASITHRDPHLGLVRVAFTLSLEGIGPWCGEIDLSLPLEDFLEREANVTLEDSGIGPLAPDLAAWVSALQAAHGSTEQGQEYCRDSLERWVAHLRNANPSRVAQTERALAFANRAVHFDLRAAGVQKAALSSLVSITDYASTQRTALALSRLCLRAQVLALGEPTAEDVALRGALDAVIAARDRCAVAAAKASVSVVDALYSRLEPPTAATWWRLREYTNEVLEQGVKKV